MNLEKYIYKLTNLVNGKSYIGQTNNLKRRFQEHLHDKRAGHPIHLALRKYGRENFSCEVLYYGEDYNEEEKKWIAYYETNNRDKGYNIAIGGQDSAGETNPMSKITQEQADQVVDLLINSELSRGEIAQTMQLDVGYIDHINHGEAWSKSIYTYPLRSFSNALTQDQVEDVVALLMDGSKSIDDIEAETGLKRYIILSINKGHTYKQKDVEYPIKELKMPEKTLLKIRDLLANTTMFYKDIAAQTGVSVSIVSNINNGTSWFDSGLKYPIRKAVTVRHEHG